MRIRVGPLKKDKKAYEDTLHRMLDLLMEIGEPIEIKGVLKTVIKPNKKTAFNKKFLRKVLKKENNFYIYRHFKKRNIH